MATIATADPPRPKTAGQQDRPLLDSLGSREILKSQRACWMFPQTAPCFVLGGRNGDLIQLLPCFKAIHDRVKARPVVICSHEYSGVLTGASYVKAHPVQEHWWQGVPTMKAIAQEVYGGGIVSQFWHQKPRSEDTIGANGKTWATIQSHGHKHGVDMSLDPDYGTSMARRCGFTRDEWMRLPLVFDRRDLAREELLARNVFKIDRRPAIVVSLSGISSPFAFFPNVLNGIRERFGRHFNIVDLAKVRGKQIYDLLGLIDRAVGVITCDTFSLHLMPATVKPYVAFTVDGWTSSVPKGNCRLEVKYGQTLQNLHRVWETVETWKANV